MAEKEKGKKPHSKSKHNKIEVWKSYKDGKIQGKWCPRCGAGTRLAQHKNRMTCGKCSYSEIQKKSQ